MHFLKKRRLISLQLSIGSYLRFIHCIINLGIDRKSEYVCVSNVHMTVEAWRDYEFAKIVNEACIATPDGMPLAKSLRLLYGVKQERVAGMDLFPDLLRAAEDNSLAIYFLGSTEEILDKIESKLKIDHPDLKIAGTCSPPFRELSIEEDDVITKNINQSGANIVMVALGCPKQEKWMAQHKGKINAVMVGVGGAFPVYAGMQSRAPVWMQRWSLEWLYRLGQEPKRLLKRYFVTNSLFIILLIREFIKIRILRIMPTVIS